MPTPPEIQVVKVEYGLFPGASSLNRNFDPAKPFLIATIDVSWEEPDPISCIARLEETLLSIWPGFGRHECHGELAYHVFLGGGRETSNWPVVSGGPASPLEGPEPFDGRLAIAHLIEHAVIDFQCSVTDERRCSGITGAYRSPEGRYDVIVECPDRRVGQACFVLATEWLTSAIENRPLGSAEKAVLTAARLAFRHSGEVLTPPAVARALGWPEPRAEKALGVLRDVGYLAEFPYTINFSGIPEYRIASSWEV